VPYERAVNCGAEGGYQASDGYWYAPDQAYAPGSWGWEGGRSDFVSSTEADIKGTVDDPIYRVHRYAMDAYRFDVPNGPYVVRLKFAEVFRWMSVGDRVFAVDIEGQRVLDQFDMLANGLRERAEDWEWEVYVEDGRLDIIFEQQSTDYAPAINGIRVRRP
jgi:hypothetical protein